MCSATSPCPGNAYCVSSGATGVCFARCTTNRDCREDDLFQCLPISLTDRICIPVPPTPVGQRDGGACYSSTQGPNQLPALARTVFAPPNLATSGTRQDLFTAAEGNVAVSPVNGAVVQPYIAIRRDGTTFIGTSVTLDGTSVLSTGALSAPVNPIASDPAIAYTRDGRLHAAFLSLDEQGFMMTNMEIDVADSADDGQHWGPARVLDATGMCGMGCDKPWIAVGPSGGDAGSEPVYVGFRAQMPGDLAALALMRSDDGAMTWTAPMPLAGVDTVA
jgi:hypothetical protein